MDLALEMFARLTVLILYSATDVKYMDGHFSSDRPFLYVSTMSIESNSSDRSKNVDGSLSATNLLQRYSYDYLIKFVLIGDERVGKSCLITRFLDSGTFPTWSHHTQPMAVDFKVKSNISVPERDLDSPPVMKTVKTQIWELNGHERFHHITSAYYGGATVVLFVFDFTNRQSFEHIKDWNRRFHYESNGKTERYLSPSLIKVLVGTKYLQNNHTVSYSEAEAMAIELKMVYWETDSSTTEHSSGFHVHDMFMDAIERQISKAKRVSLTQSVSSHAPHRSIQTRRRTWKEWMKCWIQ
jgi:small GTP-binding protein